MSKNSFASVVWAGLSLLVSACAVPSGPARVASWQFEPVNIVEPDGPAVSAAVVIDGARHPVAYHALLRTGQVFGKERFGLVHDRQGKEIEVSPRPDFTSLLRAGNGLAALTQFEHLPGAVYCSTLQQRDDGRLQATATRALKLQALHGTWLPCAGSVTPWGSHLGSEEYEPDARVFFEAADAGLRADHYLSLMTRYFGYSPEARAVQLAGAFNPYRYGFAVEHSVQGSCDAVTSKRRYAMGRLSMELAYVMPDRRTVYLTDDGDFGGFYMFIADRAGELESGRLFAARWQQPATVTDGTVASLQWLPLGHAQERDIARTLDRGIRFEDMFVRAKPLAGQCAEDTRQVHTMRGAECLRVKAGQALNASRLETRRYAALQGATTEFSKSEGMTFDPLAQTLYMAQSRLSRGTEPGAPDSKAPDHIRLPQNLCGAVLALRAQRDDALGSDYVVRDVRIALQGRPVDESRCDEAAIASPDNLSFIPEAGVLLLAEDGSRHKRNKVWAWQVASDTLTPIAVMPPYAEATSLYWYPDINGHAYLTLVVQHPYSQTPDAQLPSADAKNAWVGVIGPLPLPKKHSQ